MSLKALVIDDEQALREIICEVLKHMQIETVPVASGQKAIEFFETDGQDVNLIFLDVNMPGMNGIETYKQIRRHVPEHPIVFMSGYDAREEVDALKPEAPYTFLKKPFSMSQLMQTVKEIIP